MKKIIYLSILMSTTFNSYSSVESLKGNSNLEEEISNNSVSVTSVSEKFADEVREKEVSYKEKFKKVMGKYCYSEIEIFCSNYQDNYECLKDNFNLTTGKCRNVLKQEFGKGLYNNRLSIHDLKITPKTKLLKTENKINYAVSTYKTNEVFDYRSLRFRKGFFEARNYKYDDYNGQFVIYSGKPKNIFKDFSGISYNPYLQKGPFFFDEKGNVKIGTLNKEYEYKKHIYLKKGSVVVFNEDRTLHSGILSKSVRIGRCGYLKGMEISEIKIKECVEK